MNEANKSHLYLALWSKPYNFVRRDDRCLKESAHLRVVHFRCYIGLKSLIRILRLRIRSETGVDLQKIISERGAHQLHSVVLLIESSLATLLQLQDTADTLRSRVNTFRSDPQFYIRTCSWPRLNDPMGAVWSLPQRSSSWMWPLELWPEGTDGTSRLLHALDLTPSNQRTWTVRKRLLKNSLQTASDLIRLDRNDANPPHHILGTLDANFETYDSELREQLCKAWNLLFGWTWLSISGALTRILPTAAKSVVSSIPRKDFPSLTTLGGVSDTRSQWLHQLVVRLLATDSRILCERILGENSNGLTVDESLRHKVLTWLPRIFRCLGRISANMEPQSTLLQIRVLPWVQWDNGVKDVRVAELSFRRLVYLLRNIDEYRMCYTQPLRQGTPRFSETTLHANMNRTSLYLYVSSKRTSQRKALTKRTKTTCSQICVFCTLRPRWSVEQIEPSVELLDPTNIKTNGKPLVAHPEEQTTDRSSSMCSDSHALDERVVGFDESQSISESSIRLFDPRLVVTDPVDLTTTGSDMSVQMPRSLDDALVDSCSKPPLYYSTPLEQCKNRDESNEFSWIDHQTQDDISLLSEDSTLSAVTPRDGEHFSKVDSSLVTPEYPIEPNQTDTAQSAVPELILESEDQVTALHPVRGRPITSKLGCADAPICWYSPALEPITENSEYSVPSTTFNTVTATTTNNHQMKLAHSEAGGCIATISEEILREFNELEYAVDEVESSQAWITVQLQQFQLTLAATNGRVNDAATITNQLAQIDQLLQTLTPLGARLRNLDQRVEQVWNNLPVCESTKRYGEPSTPTKVTGDKLIEANQTSLVKSKMDTNQCAHQLLNKFHARLRRVHARRSDDLSSCEQLVAQLESTQTQHAAWSAQLRLVQQDIVSITQLLDSPQSELWGVNLDISAAHGGLDDQVRQLTALKQDVSGRLQVKLVQLGDQMLAAEAQIDGMDTTQAELTDLVEVIEHKLVCLHRIREHLGDLIKRGNAELSLLQSLSGTLVEFTNRVSCPDAPWTEEHVEQAVLSALHATADAVDQRESSVSQLLSELDQVVGAHVSSPGFDRLDRRQGSARNGKKMEQLNAELRTTWNCIKHELLVKAVESTIISVCDWITGNCQEIFVHTELWECGRLGFDRDLLEADRLQEQLATFEKHLQILNHWRAWIKQSVDGLICSRLSVQVMNQKSLNQWSHLLTVMDHSQSILESLREQGMTVLIPTSFALRDRTKRASAFLQLLKAQSRELSLTEETEISRSYADADDFDTGRNSEKTPDVPRSVQLELARVRKGQIQQLTDTVDEEQKRFVQEVTDLAQNLCCEIPETSRPKSICHPTSPSPDPCEMPPVAQLVQSYRELHETLDEQLAQSDLQIKQLLAQCSVANGNNHNAVNDLQSRNPDIQLMDSDAWESDSGYPCDPILVCGESDQNLVGIPASSIDQVGFGINCAQTVKSGYRGVRTFWSDSQGQSGQSKDGMAQSGAELIQVSSTPKDRMTSSRVIEQLETARQELSRLKARYRLLVQSVIPVTEHGAEVHHHQTTISIASRLKTALSEIQDVIHEAQDLSTQVRPFLDADTNGHEENDSSSQVVSKTRSSNGKLIGTGESGMKPFDASGDHEGEEEQEEERQLKPMSEHRGQNAMVDDKRGLSQFAWFAVSCELDTWLTEVTEFRERTLFAYELAERVDARTARLKSWTHAIQSTLASIPCAKEIDSTECISILSRLGALRLEVTSKVEPIMQLVNEADNLLEIMEDLAPVSLEDQKVESTSDGSDLVDRTCFGPLTAALAIRETHGQLLDEVIRKSMGLYTELIRVGQLSWVVGECHKSIEECTTDAMFSDDSLTENCESFSQGDTSNAFATKSIQQAVRVKRLEVQRLELDALGTILGAVTQRLQVDGQSDVSDKKLVEQRLREAQLLQQNTLHITRARCLKEQDKLSQLRQLDGALRNQATWLSLQRKQVARLADPRGTTVSAVQAGIVKFEDTYRQLDSDGSARLVQLVQLASGPNTPTVTCHADAMRLVTSFLSSTVVGSRQDVDQSSYLVHFHPAGLRQLLYEQTALHSRAQEARARWDKHLNQVTVHETRMHRLQVLFDEISGSLARLYRPSKLVPRCTEQLKEVQVALARLHEQEQNVAEMNEFLPYLKPLCQSGEWSRLVATGRAMKHRFDCLIRRGDERQRMLHQAFREDLQFERAYNRLVQLLKAELSRSYALEEEGSKQPDVTVSNAVPTSVTDSERANFWSTLRLGGNLRERCTLTDPERVTLDQMLSHLRDLWNQCARHKAEQSILCETSLYRQDQHSAAHDKLREWLRTAESSLGVSALVTGTVNDSQLNQNGSPHPAPRQSGASLLDAAVDPLQINAPYRALATQGLTPSDCQALTSVFGDEMLVTALRDEHQLLVDELQKRSDLWGCTKDSMKPASPMDTDKSTLMARMQRLRLACNLRSSALETAVTVATQLQENQSHVAAWLSEAEHYLQTFELGDRSTVQSSQSNQETNPLAQLPSSRVRRARSQRNKEGSSKSMDKTGTIRSTHSEHNEVSLLRLYEYLRCSQSIVCRGSFASICCLSERLLQPMGKSALGRQRAPHIITGSCHTKAKSVLRHKYHQLLTRWHQVDQRLRLLRARLTPKRHYANELDVSLGLEKIELRIRQWARQLRHQYPEHVALYRELEETVTEAAAHTSTTRSNTQNNTGRTKRSSMPETTRLPRRSSSVSGTCSTNQVDVDALVRRIDELTRKQLNWPTDELLNKLEKQFVQALTLQTSLMNSQTEVNTRLQAYRQAFDMRGRSGSSRLIHPVWRGNATTRSRSCTGRTVSHGSCPENKRKPRTEVDDQSSAQADDENDENENGNRLGTHDVEMNTLSVLSQPSIEFDSGLTSPDLQTTNTNVTTNTSITTTATTGHLVDTEPAWHPTIKELVAPPTDSGSMSLDHLREQRCEVVETEFRKVLKQATERFNELQQLHEAVTAHIQLKNFDFDLWRESYLHWLSVRRFRLLDLFRTRPNNLPETGSNSVLNVSNLSLNAHDSDGHSGSRRISVASGLRASHPDLSECGVTSCGSSSATPVAFGSTRSRFAGSTEQLTLEAVDHGQAENELNCSQFVQRILRDRPDFPGSSPMELRAAFRAVDTTKRGRITYQQFVDALKPERQRQALPVGELIANAIQQETDRCICDQKFLPVRVGENKYRFGSSSRVYLVRFLNSTTMVRVGGGWITLNAFLNSRDPCRARRKASTISSKTAGFFGRSLDSSNLSETPSRDSPSFLGLGSMEVIADLPGTRPPVAPVEMKRQISVPSRLLERRLPKAKPRQKHSNESGSHTGH